MEMVAEHLAACPHCANTVDDLFAVDELVVLAEHGDATVVCAEPERQRLEERAREIEVPEVARVIREGRIGPYELLEEIGRGGIGVVMRARHVHLGKLVAVKLLRPDSLGTADEVRRFRREMKSIGAIDSPHVVRARDAGEVDGTHFLVMDLVEGVDARQLVRSRGPLSVPDACEVVRQALLGVRDIAKCNVVHRDLKPSNLIVDREGVVRLLDLGLARIQHGGDDGELTQTGMMMGTAGFVAPEQVRDPRAVDVRTDLYSLGCTLFSLLTGRLPFDAPKFVTTLDRMLAHVHEEPPRPSEFRSLPEELDALVWQSLRKDPAERPSTPDEFSTRLAPHCAGADLKLLVDPPSELDLEGEFRPSLAYARTRLVDPVDGGTAQPRNRSVPPRPLGLVARIGSGLLATAIIVALALAYWPEDSKRDDVVPPEPPFELPFDLDALPAGRWYDLLERAPREDVWPDSTQGSRWRHEESRELQIDNRVRRALLALGETTSESYTLRVHVHQTDWTGDVGIYFGDHPAPEEGEDCRRAQYFRLLPRSERVGGGFVVERGHLIIHPDDVLGLDVDTTGIESHTVSDVYGEEILEIRVERGQLGAVFLGGIELTPLHHPNVNAQFGREDYAGTLGIYIGRATADFHTAQFRVTTVTNPQNSEKAQ